MKNKVWSKTTITIGDEQAVEIYPTEMYDGIVVEIKELDDKTSSGRLYLCSEDEMEFFISKMQEMMNYALGK